MSTKNVEYNNIRDLIESCYVEIKRRAGKKMMGEQKNHSWTQTVLAHELVERLLKTNAEIPLNKNDFFPYASKMMTRLLIDHARKRNAKKRSYYKRELRPIENFERKLKPGEWCAEEWLEFDELCNELSGKHPRAVEVFRMIIFGWKSKDVARFLGISETTASGDNNKIKALLALKYGLGDRSPKGDGDGNN